MFRCLFCCGSTHRRAFIPDPGHSKWRVQREFVALIPDASLGDSMVFQKRIIRKKQQKIPFIFCPRKLEFQHMTSFWNTLLRVRIDLILSGCNMLTWGCEGTSTSGISATQKVLCSALMVAESLTRWISLRRSLSLASRPWTSSTSPGWQLESLHEVDTNEGTCCCMRLSLTRSLA